MSTSCHGEHHIFCAEVIGIESLGKVIVINVCTACNDVTFHEHIVSDPGTSIRLLKEEKKQKEKT